MNSDLVNRDAALLAIHNFQTAKGWQNGLHEMDIHKVLLKLPTVYAVEVVRCKECKHAAIDAYANRRMCIRNGEIRPDGRIWFGTAVDDEHYCAYGIKVMEDA